MKLIKKSLIILLIVFTLILSLAFSACGEKEAVEKDREGKTYVDKWSADGPFYSGLPFNSGVPFKYEFENAKIEMNNLSEQAQFWVTVYEKGEDNNFFIGKTEHILHSNCPYEYEGGMLFQWLPNYDLRELSDYITFKARIEDEIVGYAVIYIWTDGEIGNGKVLVDKECKKTSEEIVNKKIQDVIEEHKSAI